MYSPYRGRSQTKKRCSNCKPKITAAEKKQRSIVKKLAKIFPYRQFHLQFGKQKSIYQHSIKAKYVQTDLFPKNHLLQ